MEARSSWSLRESKTLPMVQKGQLCILHIHIVQVNGGQMQGLSTEEKYSKVTLWWKGYYLNK